MTHDCRFCDRECECGAVPGWDPFIRGVPCEGCGVCQVDGTAAREDEWSPRDELWERGERDDDPV